MNLKVIGATWCSECKSLTRMLDSDGVPYTYVDADTPIGWETTAKYRVKGLPTVILNDEAITGKDKCLLKIKELKEGDGGVA